MRDAGKQRVAVCRVSSNVVAFLPGGPSFPCAPVSILEPVRVHFASGRPKELLEMVKKFRPTR